MGFDFVEKVTPTLKRGWDHNLPKLTATDLFTVAPKAGRRTFRIKPDEGQAFQEREDRTP